MTPQHSLPHACPRPPDVVLWQEPQPVNPAIAEDGLWRRTAEEGVS